MILKPLEINSYSQLSEILGTLGAARIRRDIKILSGSFDEGSIIDVKFRVKSSGEVWRLQCLNEAPFGA
jgi:hypothetical protein